MTRNVFPVALATCLACLALPGGAAAAEDPYLALVGCYAATPDRPGDLRVRKHDDGYVLEGIGAPYALIPRPIPAKAASDPMLSQVELVMIAEMPVFGMFQLREGAVIDGAPAETRFYFYAPQVGGFVHRRPCPDG